jgi:hypothetical protein
MVEQDNKLVKVKPVLILYISKAGIHWLLSVVLIFSLLPSITACFPQTV